MHIKAIAASRTGGKKADQYTQAVKLRYIWLLLRYANTPFYTMQCIWYTCTGWLKIKYPTGEYAKKISATSGPILKIFVAA